MYYGSTSFMVSWLAQQQAGQGAIAPAAGRLGFCQQGQRQRRSKDIVSESEKSLRVMWIASPHCVITYIELFQSPKKS